MSHIVFFNFQAYGHINPSLGIAQELVQRGEKGGTQRAVDKILEFKQRASTPK